MQHLPVGHHQAKQAVTFREIRSVFSTALNGSTSAALEGAGAAALAMLHAIRATAAMRGWSLFTRIPFGMSSAARAGRS